MDDSIFMEKFSHPSNSCGGIDGGDSTNSAASSGATSGSIITTSSNTTNNNTNSRGVYLKHLNKISHKISKPIRCPPTFDQNQPQNPPTSEIPPSQAPPPQQHQPPVYNINKKDFRDVVQRLTGSPAHEQHRISTPPAIQPKPPSSRLQRIRPPPLSQIINRPPPPPNILNSSSATGFLGGQLQPLSPLPPFPAVHAAAESPISAYMRFLKSSSSIASPKWNNLPMPQMTPPALQQQQNTPPAPQASMAMPQFPLPTTSPLSFGCFPSPRSAYAMLSPTAQLGFQQLPLSPSLPVPSPRWKGI